MATVRKRSWKNGKGESRSGFTVDYIDTQGERQRRQFATRAEANAFRTEIEDELRKGTYRPEADKTTVGELAERFLQHCRERMQRGERMTRHNLAVYEGYVRNYICPDPEWHARKHAKPHHRFHFFAKGLTAKTLRQLTKGTITQFRDDLRSFGVSVPTTRKIITMLRVMFNYGIGIDLMAINPAADIEVIGRRDEKKPIIPPDKEVMRELIALADTDFAMLLAFAAATGLRAGEVHALRWKHISFSRREVHVETRVDAYGEEDVPKSVAGIRTIPIADALILSLKEWRMHSPFKQPEDLAFPNRKGAYQNHDDMVRDKFDPLFERLICKAKDERWPDVPERFTWHALRHFAISCWIDAGLPPKTVQTFAGHSSLQVTMDRYGHLFRSDRHAAAMDGIAAEIYVPKPYRPHEPQRRRGDGQFARKT